MDRDQLRQEIMLTLLNTDTGGTPRSLAMSIGEETTPSAVRGILLNLERDGMVTKIEEHGGTRWKANEAEIRTRLQASFAPENDEAGRSSDSHD